MVVEILLAAFGLVLLTYAADHLVLGSSRLARRLRVRPVVVGVVVIGIGTSAPEFLVSGLAAARGDTGLAVGNLVGSNILNLTLILGIAAVIAPIPVSSAVVRREVRLAFAAIVLFGLLLWLGLDTWAATLLTVEAAAAMWLLIRWARSADPAPAPLEPEAEPEPAAGERWWIEAVRALAGLAGVLAGAELLVGGASSVATELGVSQAVIGFTLVALGTSLPELVTSIQGQRRGETELVVGNLFGSNLFNSLIGGAVVGFAGGAPADHAGVVLIIAMIVSAALAWGLVRFRLTLSRWRGAVLLLAYLAMTPLLLAA
jgi:cation:H+ antiporter